MYMYLQLALTKIDYSLETLTCTLPHLHLPQQTHKILPLLSHCAIVADIAQVFMLQDTCAASSIQQLVCRLLQIKCRKGMPYNTCILI